MDFSKSKVLLKKINTLHESADSFNQEFSSLEKDLFLQYLRELYECVSKTAENTSGVVGKRSAAPKEINIEPKRESPKKEYVLQAIEKVESVNPIVTNGSHAPIQSSNKIATSEVIKEIETKQWEPELKELFEATTSSETGNRFANTAVADISKGMGINERILTINELFDGNQQLYQQVVSQLNSLTSFEQALEYLASGVASENKWGHKKRKMKAEVFLNLVKRRYL